MNKNLKHKTLTGQSVFTGFILILKIAQQMLYKTGILGASSMAQWVKPLAVELASQMGIHLSPRCSTSDHPPSNVPEKVAEEGRSVWVPTSREETQKKL